MANAATKSGFPTGTLVHPTQGLIAEVVLPFDLLRRHAAVIGGAGTGKTAGIIVPWICAALAQGHTVVATDVKGDLLDDVLLFIRRYYGTLGVRVAKWDYTDPSRSVSWDWIGELVDDGSIDAAVTAILGREKQGASDPYFYRRDATLLRGVLRVAPHLFPANCTSRELLSFITDWQAVTALLAEHPAWPGASEISSAVGSVDAADFSKVISGVSTALARFIDPGLEAVSRKPGILLDELFNQPTLLVVAAPMKQAETSKMSSSLLLNILVQRLYRRFGKAGQRHCFLFLDESPRIVDRFAFEEVLSVSRSAGVSVVLAAQDVAQFKDENERSAILGNCATAVVLPGASRATSQWLQSRLGRHSVPLRTLNAQVQGGLRTGISSSLQSEPVLGDRELGYPPFGTRPAILHASALELGITSKPIIVDLQY